jgi:hypothetical protein
MTAFVKEELLVFYSLCIFIARYFDVLHLIEDNDGEHMVSIFGCF